MPHQVNVRPHQVTVRPHQVTVRTHQANVRPHQVSVRPHQINVRPHQVHVRPYQVNVVMPHQVIIHLQRNKLVLINGFFKNFFPELKSLKLIFWFFIF